MATPLNKGAKKISSLFSLSNARENSTSVLSEPGSSSHVRGSSIDYLQAEPALHASLAKSASNPNLSGHKTNASINPRGPMPPHISSIPLSPLAPPPALVNYGPPRPASGHDSISSRQSSRPASREASRSRPSTPNTMAAPGTANSPSARTQITPRDSKISKRHSWLPKRPGQREDDVESHEPKAWIAGLREHVPYDMTPVLSGGRVCTRHPSPSTLLNEHADTRIVERPSGHVRLSFLSKIWTGPIPQDPLSSVLEFEEPYKSVSPG